MGFKRIELYPVQSPSTITPPAKEVLTKAFAVVGSAAATATYAWLPANSTIVDAKVVVKTAGNGTNTTISVGTGAVTNSLFSEVSVTQATVSRVTAATDMVTMEGNQPGSDIKVTAHLGGAASTTGVFIVILDYIV